MVSTQTPIPLPHHDVAAAFLLVVTTGGIRARSGVDAARSRQDVIAAARAIYTGAIADG